MEVTISKSIIRRYFEKLESSLDIDVAIIGAGPSGLICAWDLARKGRSVAVFESQLKPGGGVWGGAMLFNELVVQDEALHFLDELGVRHVRAGEGISTADSVETAASLTYHAVHAGAKLFNAVTVEDVLFNNDRINGVVINWAPVLDRGMHVDPLMVRAKFLVDAGGHDAKMTASIAHKAGIRLETKTGDVMGERPMWATEGERTTVENSGRVYPGLYVCGMAANGVHGSFRMGPIFGGMFMSGRKVGDLIEKELA